MQQFKSYCPQSFSAPFVQPSRAPAQALCSPLFECTGCRQHYRLITFHLNLCAYVAWWMYYFTKKRRQWGIAWPFSPCTAVLFSALATISVTFPPHHSHRAQVVVLFNHNSLMCPPNALDTKHTVCYLCRKQQPRYLHTHFFLLQWLNVKHRVVIVYHICQ